MSQIPANLILPQHALSQPTRNLAVQGWSDFLGLAASVGCAIHCAAVPIVLSFLPSWNLGWMAHQSFHQWMFGACLLIAVVAFLPGLLRHRNPLPIALGSVGLTLVGIAAFSSGSCGCGSCSHCTQSAAKSERINVLPRAIANIASLSESQQFKGASAPTRMTFVSSRTEPAIQNEPVEASAVLDNEEPWWAFAAPWLTPTGGLFLVIAHLLNHHIGHCRRC